MSEYINSEHKALSEKALELTEAIKKRAAKLPFASTVQPDKKTDSERQAQERGVIKLTAELGDVEKRIKEIEKAADAVAKAAAKK